MEAAFVDLGLPRNGFLYVDDVVVPGQDPKSRRRRKIDELLKPGQEVLVQVVKDSMGTKGAARDDGALDRRPVPRALAARRGLGRVAAPARRRARAAAQARPSRSRPTRAGSSSARPRAGATADDLERDLRFLQQDVGPGRGAGQAGQGRQPGVRRGRPVAEGDPRPARRETCRRCGSTPSASTAASCGWVRTTQPEFVDRIKLYSDQRAALRALRRRAGDPLDPEPARRPAVRAAT